MTSIAQNLENDQREIAGTFYNSPRQPMLSPFLSQTSIKNMQDCLHFSPDSSLTVKFFFFFTFKGN